MYQLARTHAHHNIRGRGIGPKVSAILCLDSLSNKPFFRLTGEIHHVSETQLHFPALEFHRNPQIFWNAGWFEVSVAPHDLYVSLTLLRKRGYSVSNNLMACSSADSLQVEGEATVAEQVVSADFHAFLFKPR